MFPPRVERGSPVLHIKETHPENRCVCPAASVKLPPPYVYN